MSPFDELFNSRIRLPSPPAIAIKILETVRKDDFAFQDLAYIIESDPALTARVLRMANSSYYNASSNVTSITKALSILGTHAVLNIALSFVICTELMNTASEGFDVDLFWRRAVTAAVAADETAKLVKHPSHDLFIVALLQDIGIPVLHSCFPQQYQQVINKKMTSQTPLIELERKQFGFDHLEVGAELLKCWQLPEEIHLPIRYLHQGCTIPSKYRPITDILTIAGRLSSFYNGSQDVDKIRKVKQILDRSFNVVGESVDQLVENTVHNTLAILDSFEVSPGDLRPFSVILQEANEQLSRLYDSYELMVIELKHAKEKAEKLALELNDANERHRELAFKDGLTDLYNYRYFQEAMDLEFMRAQRYNRVFSMILLDLDHFKEINDTHGHTIGDFVLANVGKAVAKSVRETDIVARYGGDEFAVILPETADEDAIVVAEHIRKNIESCTMTIDDLTIKVTTSMGIASNRCALDLNNKAALVSLADKALYLAKNKGKNRVHSIKFAGI